MALLLHDDWRLRWHRLQRRKPAADDVSIGVAQ